MEMIDTSSERVMCGQCQVHGFPCRLCSILKYDGTLGPGFLRGKRYMFTNDLVQIPEETEVNMLIWLLTSGGPNLEITTTDRYLINVIPDATFDDSLST